MLLIEEVNTEQLFHQSPSLFQKLRNFHSLSCPGITGADSCQSTQAPPPCSSTSQCLSDFISSCDPESQQRTKAGGAKGEEPSNDEQDSDSTGSGDSALGNPEETETLWEGPHRNGKDFYQLGGELDIEQIERN